MIRWRDPRVALTAAALAGVVGLVAAFLSGAAVVIVGAVAGVTAAASAAVSNVSSSPSLLSAPAIVHQVSASSSTSRYGSARSTSVSAPGSCPVASSRRVATAACPRWQR
ncbi:hypothetical protein ACFQ08_39585, partial [Streptosporangium algeriense]